MPLLAFGPRLAAVMMLLQALVIVDGERNCDG